ncbi:MAG: VOC family protein [Chloroflexi bacterium]|nr:VOC family protein [Chloroflexota bacterium]
MGRNGEAAQRFYASLFDWKIDTESMGGGYGLVAGEAGGIGGGIMGLPEYPPSVMIYVQVENLEEHLAKAESLGGKRIYEPQEIPGVGAWASFADPDGNVIGLFKPR